MTIINWKISLRFLTLGTIVWIATTSFFVMACQDEESTSPAPTITSFSPTSGEEGAPVTITGTNFSTTAADNTVAFNGTAATVTSATDTQLTVAVPTGATTGKITVTINGNTATSGNDFTVGTVATVDCSNATTTVEKVVCAAEAFMATLSEDELATLIVDYSQDNVIQWSNLPCGSGCRNGLQLSNLTDEQVKAALAVVEAATGTTENEGYDEINQIRAADDVLNSASGSGGGPGGGGYSSGIYFIAFLGTPSTTSTWQLQFGGHHLAVNTTFEAGAVTGATPVFEGIEPKTWTADDGTTYAPLGSEQATMAAMLASLSDTELASAKLSSTFSDVLLGPDQDGQFPTTKSGIVCSSLTSEQKALVMAAMQPWVQDTDDATAASLLATYENELDNTYISYSGNATLDTHQDYVRIDGPSVWIEFVCQDGVVYRDQIHYHSIWRDHTRDYGGNYTF